jgi:hypothetical protein
MTIPKKPSIPPVTTTPTGPTTPVVNPASKEEVAAVSQQVAQASQKLALFPDPARIATFQAGANTLPLSAMPPASFLGFKEGPMVAGVQTYVPDPDTIAQALQPVAFEGYVAGPVTNGVQTYIADATEFAAMLARIGISVGGGGTVSPPATVGLLQNFIVGDSQDVGYLTSGEKATSWPTKRYALLDNTKYSAPVFIAVTGETLVQQLARVQNQLLPAIDTANFVRAHIDLGGGTNDAGAGATAAQITQRRKDIINVVRAWQAAHNNFPITIGVKGWTKNAKDNQAVSVDVSWAVCQEANNDWIANYKSYGADYYTNYLSRVELTDPFNTTYFNIDRLHRTDAACDIEAVMNKAVIEAAYTGAALAPAANYVAPANTGGGGTTTPPDTGTGGGTGSGTVTTKSSADYTQVSGDFRSTSVLGETILFSNALDAVATLAFNGASFTLTHAHYGQYNYFAKYDVFVDNVYDGSVDLTNYTGSAGPAVRFTSKTYAAGAHVAKLVATGATYPAFLPLPLATISGATTTTGGGGTTSPVPTPDPTPTPTPVTLTQSGTKTYLDVTEGDSSQFRGATLNGRTFRFSDVMGASYTFAFTGKAFEFDYGNYSANNFYENYDVYVDNQLDATRHETAAEADVFKTRFQSKVYAQGDHNVQVVCKGFAPVDTIIFYS